MTNRVDRLEARGLVQRLPDPRDRRGVHRPAHPAAARSAVDAALADLLARERDLLGDARAPTSATLLAGLLRRARAPFDAEDTR